MRKQFKLGALLKLAHKIGDNQGNCWGLQLNLSDHKQIIKFTSPVMLLADRNTDPEEYTYDVPNTTNWYALLILSREGKLAWCMRHWFEEA